MSHDHHHSHAQTSSSRRIGVVLALTAGYAAAELIGGLLSNSLALLADAGHMLTDIFALSVALFATITGRRPADRRNTFGYKRVEILGALFNGTALLVIAVLIAIEAWTRWDNPPEIDVPMMATVAFGGLIVNLVAAYLLHSDRQQLNIRAAYYHVLGDLLGSVGALVAAGAIGLFGWRWADPAASVIISLIILVGAIRLLMASVHVLLEGVPKHLDIDEVGRALMDVPDVCQVHEMHLWSLRGTEPLLSAHLVVETADCNDRVLREATVILRDRFGIDHTTLQIEPADFNIDGDVLQSIRDRT
ncbi:MAG: cation diffusion facilitator family transporter [Acidobacteriota bacterium]|nr:cation diffusion facilitator family transporter [Acidobacteriota bacterium]MDH3785735.1 cation diffusion facilitator family transporter [Acidobacteriota bacterium]